MEEEIEQWYEFEKQKLSEELLKAIQSGKDQASEERGFKARLSKLHSKYEHKMALLAEEQKARSSKRLLVFRLKKFLGFYRNIGK